MLCLGSLGKIDGICVLCTEVYYRSRNIREVIACIVRSGICHLSRACGRCINRTVHKLIVKRRLLTRKYRIRKACKAGVTDLTVLTITPGNYISVEIHSRGNLCTGGNECQTRKRVV